MNLRPAAGSAFHIWSCLERVRGKEYPLRGLVWFWGWVFLGGILHADWQPLETAFSGASLFLCMPGLRGSAGLYHLNNVGRWSSCSTVCALDLRFVPDTLLFLLGQHRWCICSDTWKSVMGRIRSSHNHCRRTFPLNHLYFEAFLKRSKTKSTLNRAEHYVNYLTKSIEKIKKIQSCLSCNPVVTLLLFLKGKHTVMECITNVMSWGRSGLLSAQLPTFPGFWESKAPPGYFLWLWFLCYNFCQTWVAACRISPELFPLYSTWFCNCLTWQYKNWPLGTFNRKLYRLFCLFCKIICGREGGRPVSGIRGQLHNHCQWSTIHQKLVFSLSESVKFWLQKWSGGSSPALAAVSDKSHWGCS